MNRDGFINWLIVKKGLKQRSSKDVFSNLIRAGRYVSLLEDIPVDELIFKLDRNDEFNSFTRAVKSHMRRAVRLYREYKEK